MANLKDYVYFSPSNPYMHALPRKAAVKGFALYDYRKDGSKVLLANCYGTPFVLWPDTDVMDSLLRNEARIEEVVRHARATTLNMRGLNVMQRVQMAYWMRYKGIAPREVRNRTAS